MPPTDDPDRVWYCTKCWKEGPRPKFIILDGTYGSARCNNSRCGGEKRIFHEELRHDIDTELERVQGTPQQP